jgi:hypothetical protein
MNYSLNLASHRRNLLIIRPSAQDRQPKDFEFRETSLAGRRSEYAPDRRTASVVCAQKFVRRDKIQLFSYCG